MRKRSGRLALRTIGLLAVWFSSSSGMQSANAEPLQLNSGLAQLLRYFELRVSSGRIAAHSAHRDRKLESQASVNDRRERLAVTLSGDATAISYEQATAEWQIRYEIVAGREIELRRQPKDASMSPALAFRQPARGPISLRLVEGGVERTYEAENLWRLLAAQPEVCRLHLTPLLELLRPDWQLMQTAQGAERALFAAVRTMEQSDQAKLQKLVDELASGRFARRERAERQLRAQGRDALPFLMSLDERRLDAEQRFRLQGLFRELSGGGEDDTPERIALWLIRDPQLWVQMLRHDDESHRRLALAQLERLLGRPLSFDPSADQDVRAGQIEIIEKLALEAAQRREP